MTRDLPDRAARLESVLEFREPVVVEAGAGTGKTALLAARVLAWSLGPGWAASEAAIVDASENPEAIARRVWGRMLALTFTEAAAAEMAVRITQALEDLVAGIPPPAWLTEVPLPEPEILKVRCRHLQGNFGWLRVRTFHGWANDLLREHGSRLGLDQGPTVDSDGSRIRQVVEGAVALQWPRQLPGLSREQLSRAFEARVSPRWLSELLQEIFTLGLPVEALDRDFFSPHDLEVWFERLAGTAHALGEVFQGVAWSKREKRGPQARDFVASLIQLLSELPRNRDGWARLQSWLFNEKAEAVANLQTLVDPHRSSSTLRDLQAQHPELLDRIGKLEAQLQVCIRTDPDQLDATLRLLTPLAREVERTLRLQGIASFGNLLQWASALLDDPEILRVVRSGLDQIVVDELQDTDELQLRLLEQLGLPRPGLPCPGLFGVGDPKQSIYGWRRARLPAYRRFVARLLGNRKPLELVANFRSAEGLLGEVASVLQPLMTEESEVAVPFVPLLATGPRLGQPGLVEYWQHSGNESQPSAARATARRRVEAEAIAADIADQLSAPTPPGSIGILLRNTTGLELYLEALRGRGIPHAVAKDRNYYRRREILDALSLLRAILDPTDELSLLATLRSPAVGVPDAVLRTLWEEGLPTLNQRANAGVEADSRALTTLCRAAKRRLMSSAAPKISGLDTWLELAEERLRDLFELRAAFGALSPGAWLDRVRERFPLELVAAGRYLASYRLANLERFFLEAETWLVEDPSLSRWLDRFERLASEQPDRSEAQLSDSEGRTPVQVLTWHGAKGLEFDVVYLPDLLAPTHRRNFQDRFRAEWVEDRWELQLGTLQTPGMADAVELLERIGYAEQNRLLYVAMTRARSRLILCGLSPERAPRGTLALRFQARLLEVKDGSTAEEHQGGKLENAHGVRWRLLPSFEESSDLRFRVRRKHHPPAPKPAEVEETLARWQEEANAARTRQHRKLFLPMTEDLPEPRSELQEAPESDRFSSRSEALAEGVALHHACELVELFAQDPNTWMEEVAQKFRTALPPRIGFGSAWASFQTRLERLSTSSLWNRLLQLRGQVVARELPVGLSNHREDPSAPLWGFLGKVDLVLQETDGQLLIVDFKSDRIPSQAALEERLITYRLQLRRYAEALKQAFRLPHRPRAELWFLELDRAIAVEDGD